MTTPEYHKEYYARPDIKEKHSQYMKEYYIKNKETILTKQKSYYQNNKEKIREYMKEYMRQYKGSSEKTIDV